MLSLHFCASNVYPSNCLLLGKRICIQFFRIGMLHAPALLIKGFSSPLPLTLTGADAAGLPPGEGAPGLVLLSCLRMQLHTNFLKLPKRT